MVLFILERGVRMNVGKNIAKLRKEKKLTQEELAKKINVSPKTISSYENNHNLPNIEILISLSQELGVSINDILGVNEENSKEIKNKYENKNFLQIVIIFLISIIPMIYFSINEYVVGDTVISVYEKTGVLEPENIMTIIKVSAVSYIIIIVFGLFMYWLYKKNKNKILLFISGIILLLTIPEVFHFNIYNFEVYIYTLLGIVGLIFSIKGLLKKNSI